MQITICGEKAAGRLVLGHAVDRCSEAGHRSVE